MVSKEYTVLKEKPGYDARVIRALLRSPEIRAEMLLRTTGANRTRIRWEDIKDIVFPYPDDGTVGEFLRHLADAEAARETALRKAAAAARELDGQMPNAVRVGEILDAFKPPK